LNWWIITEDLEAMPKLPPLHPGEVLREEFMTPLKLSAGQLAKALGVPRTRIERLAAEQIGLSADTALRLARYFNTSAEFWMALKSRHERERAEDVLGKTLQRIKPRAAA
jgi:addiction module HigA family antidote